MQRRNIIVNGTARKLRNKYQQINVTVTNTTTITVTVQYGNQTLIL